MAEKNHDNNENVEKVLRFCRRSVSVGEEKAFSLNLNDCSLQYLPDSLNSFNISDVNLSHNEFCEFPPIICDFNTACLTELRISSNKLSKFSPKIKKLTNLHTIVADHNDFSEFPAEILELPSLTKLTLSHNSISCIPKEIESLKSLKIFDISRNSLNKALPTEMCNLVSLEEFRAESCRLSSLPEGFDQLQNLKVLIIGSNPDLGFPFQIETLTNLEVLHLNKNSITTFRKMTSKGSIRKKFRNKHIMQVFLPEGAFKKLGNLRHLNIAENDVENFTALASLKYLEYLDITRNPISSLPDTISEMRYLEMLRTDVEYLPKSLDRNRVRVEKGPPKLPSHATNVESRDSRQKHKIPLSRELFIGSSANSKQIWPIAEGQSSGAEIEDLVTVKDPKEDEGKWSQTGLNDTAYPMNLNRHGLSVIFNFENFEGEDKGRPGAKKDVERVEDVFSNYLNYKVEIHQDLNYEDLMCKLNHYRHYDHTEYDSFVCFFMSHGNENGVSTSDNKNVKMEDVRKMFTGDGCPSLERKPKMFFIQACRGGRQYQSKYHKDYSRPRQENASHTELRVKIANEIDFLFAYASQPNAVSYRHVEIGSVYIQILTETLKEYAREEHLLDMLTIVRNRVFEKRIEQKSAEVDQEVDQIPHEDHSFTKKVYFFR